MIRLLMPLPLKSVLAGERIVLPIKERTEMTSNELAEIDSFALKAATGDSEAEFVNGLCWFAGYGTPKDYSNAVYWYSKAASKGHNMAAYNLGACYAAGFGLPKDFSQSVKWFRQAAERGYAPAQFNLGCRYFAGEGVTQSFEVAVDWWRRSANQGYLYAVINLADCYLNGSGVLRDEVQAYAMLLTLDPVEHGVERRLSEIRKLLSNLAIEEAQKRAVQITSSRATPKRS
jgi:TPR repeat protein